MGLVRTRTSSGGETRYLGLYCDVKGQQRSAGTYATAEKATRAWQKAEEKISEGRLGDAGRGRQKFIRYVEGQWLPHHQMEARTPGELHLSTSANSSCPWLLAGFTDQPSSTQQPPLAGG